MKFLLFLLFLLPFSLTIAQKQQFTIHHLPLPGELASADNQFSGLYVHEGRLFLLSECRLQEKAEAKLYAINLSDLDRKINDASYILPYRKYPIYNLHILFDKIHAAGQNYEGLEAMIIDSNKVLLSVETDTPSPNCYMLTGQINDTAIMLNAVMSTPLSKPKTADSSFIYNAGFEAMTIKDDHIFAFYEFNYFPSGNFVYQFDQQTLKNNSTQHKVAIKKLPFRVTDITYVGKNHFTAINYFYMGDGPDSVYRTPAKDRRNNKRIKDEAGYKNYCRLIDIKLKGSGFRWKPLWDFPEQFMGYNWEGIAAYKNGYFITNDKYTPQRPFVSALLYLQKVK
jgi:hypothetical protein